MTWTGDPPIGNGTGEGIGRGIGRGRGRGRRRRRGIVDELLRHGIAQLECGQGVAELRDIVVTEPKPEIQATLELVEIVVGEALGPRQILLLHIPFQHHPLLLPFPFPFPATAAAAASSSPRFHSSSSSLVFVTLSLFSPPLFI